MISKLLIVLIIGFSFLTLFTAAKIKSETKQISSMITAVRASLSSAPKEITRIPSSSNKISIDTMNMMYDILNILFPTNRYEMFKCTLSFTCSKRLQPFVKKHRFSAPVK